MIALYPGTFSPLSLGHEDIIIRASKLFNQLVIGVSIDNSKNNKYSLEERLFMLSLFSKNLPNVTFEAYTGLTVDFAVKKNAGVIVRACRDTKDFNFEASLANMNNIINSKIESIILISSDSTRSISSSNIRSILDAGGDASCFLSNEVCNYLKSLK